MNLRSIVMTLALLFPGATTQAEGYLRAEDTHIVDDSGKAFILRGMGLGGWMLQEGYMLQLGEVGQQHRIAPS